MTAREEKKFWREADKLRKDENYNKDAWEKVRNEMGLPVKKPLTPKRNNGIV